MTEQRIKKPDTIRQQIVAEVAAISPIDDKERGTIAEVITWIESGVEIFRRRKPDVPKQHLVSYSLLIDGEYVLLVDHRNAGLWLPNGGHVEPGEHPRIAAARELKEELGVDLSDSVLAPLFITRTKTQGIGKGHTDVSLWYVFGGSRALSLSFDGSEFDEARWFHRRDVPFNRSDPEMSRFLQKLP